MLRRCLVPVLLALISSIAWSADAPPKVTLTFAQPVSAGLPVWVHVTFPKTPDLELAQQNLRYPFSAEPWDFQDHSFEVKRAGKLLPLRVDPSQQVHVGGLGSAAPSTAPAGRLPLHLLYRFDQPGKYLVRYRYTGLHTRAGSGAVLAESAWTELTVRPSSPQQRAAWLKSRLAHPPTDPGQLVGDYLPSLLATSVEQVLTALLRAIEGPEGLVQSYATTALAYYPDTALLRVLPEAIRKHGPTVSLAYFISHHPRLLRPAGDRLVEATLPYLEAREPERAAGALQTLVFMENANWGLDAPAKARIDTAIWAHADRLLQFQEFEVLSPLATFLAVNRGPRAGPLLWSLAERPAFREQALIALAWLGQEADLPKLGALLTAADAPASSLPYQLRRTWGEKATPYLIAGLRSPAARTRFECARELAQAGHAEGFQYLRQVLQERDEKASEWVMQELRDYYGLAQRASRKEALELLDKKLQTPPAPAGEAPRGRLL